MRQGQRSDSRLVIGLLAVFAMGAAVQETTAAEVTVQIDSLSGGDTGALQLGFIAGESAAVWLTSPCDGNIVALQVFWRSSGGGAAQSIEDSITIFDGSTFPTPGVQLEQIVGPVMTDGVINEFRFLDDNMAIPLIVPVTNGQVFVVSFKFLNTPVVTGVSVVTDGDGINAANNAIFAVPGGWLSAALLGVSGDFVIRAVVDCADTQACCFDPTGCLDLAPVDCVTAGGFSQGVSTACATTVCFPNGACCNPDGTCDPNVDEADCVASGGVFQGDQSICELDTCPAPDGACCLSNDSCLLLTQTECAVIPMSSWAGANTICPDDCGPFVCVVDDDCNDDLVCTQDSCSAGNCSNLERLYGDVNFDMAVNIFDILCVLDGFSGTFVAPCTLSNVDLAPCPGGSGDVNIFDILGVLDAFSGTNVCGCAAGP